MGRRRKQGSIFNCGKASTRFATASGTTCWTRARVCPALRHRSIGSTGVYLEADGRDVDQWRAKAISGACEQQTPAPAALTLAEIQREIARLSKAAAAMQAEADVQPDAVQADGAPQPAPVAFPEAVT